MPGRHSKIMLNQTVTQAIAAWPFSLASGELLGVALSGGADSTALLLAAARRWPGQVAALHVNHGLQTAANEFETHCANLCSKLNVPLRCIKVNAHAIAGESPEDAARKARYAALAKLCSQEGRQQIKSVALGQHADDQVETLLLALSRGSGLAGVAGMPSKFDRAGLMFHRPLLNLSSSQIRQWLRAEGFDWVEDPTNTDLRYTRNRIRAKLLPALEETFPQFRDTFARSTRHAAQANELLLEYARLDLQTVGNPVQIRALQNISKARQANVLRLWLAVTYGEHARPNTAQLEELLSQIEACTTRGHKLHIKIGSGYVHRTDDVLVWQKSV